MNRPVPGAILSRRRATLVAVGFVGALALCWTWPVFKQLQADSYRLLYAGRWIAEHGLPYREVFTVSAHGRSFADQQWLAELIDYEAWRAAGYNGFALLMAGAFGGAFAMLAAMMRRRGASVALAISCAALALLGTFGTTFLRAQVLALPLFVAVLWICLHDSERARPWTGLLLLLPLLALWANLHGSVLIGVALVCAYGAGRAALLVRRRRWRPASGYAGLVVAAALAPIATPYGSHVLVYYQHMIGNSAIPLADVEWAPPAFATFAFFQFVVPLLLAGAALTAVVAKRSRPPWALIGAVAITGVASALAARDTVWLAIAASALLADTSSAWLPSRETGRPLLIGLSMAGVALTVTAVALFVTRTGAGFQSQAPIAAIAATAGYTSSHPCARVIADNASASALLWLAPQIAGRVGFDGELEAYPPAALVSWTRFQAAAGPHWLAAARGYRVLLASSASQPRLARRLAHLGRGPVLARDAGGIAVLAGGRVTNLCQNKTARASLARRASGA